MIHNCRMPGTSLLVYSYISVVVVTMYHLKAWWKELWLRIM